MWLNGTRFDRFITPVTLKAGRNRMLVKVCQGPHHRDPAVGNAWTFQLRLCSPDGQGLAFKTVSPADKQSLTKRSNDSPPMNRLAARSRFDGARCNGGIGRELAGLARAGPQRRVARGQSPDHLVRHAKRRLENPVPGLGVGGPIVWGDRIFVTDSDGPRLSNLHVICVSRDSGKELWHDQFWGTAPTLHHETKSSMATPVPVTDGKLVFSFFGTGDVFSTTLDGELVWHRSLASEYGPFENRFAASSSPLVVDNLVIVQCDHYGDVVRPGDRQSRPAPTPGKSIGPNTGTRGPRRSLCPPRSGSSGTAARQELILCGSEKLDAFDPATGHKLWTVRGMLRECIPTPVFGERSHLRRERTKRPDAGRPSGWPRRRDRVAGGLECASASAPFVPVGHRRRQIVRPRRRWRAFSRASTPARELAAGRSGCPAGIRPRPLLATGKFISSTRTAQPPVILRRQRKAYRQLAQNSIGEPIFATPALSGGRLLIRTPEHLWCIGPNLAEAGSFPFAERGHSW